MSSNNNKYITLRSQVHSGIFRFWDDFNRIANTINDEDETACRLQEKFADIMNECIDRSYDERTRKNEFICESLLSCYKSLFRCLPVHIEFIEEYTYIHMYPDYYVSMDRFSIGIGLRISNKEYNLLKIKNSRLLSILEERFSTYDDTTGSVSSVHVDFHIP